VALSAAAATLGHVHPDLARALADPGVAQRYLDKVVTIPGSECSWWIGAISGGGHGRFWVGDNLVVVAHRFGFALAQGLEALRAAPLLAHRCDNPLCQRVHPDHLVASTAARNRQEWAIRRHVAGLPLSDPRGSRGRAEALRALVRRDPSGVLADHAQMVVRFGEQRPLF
jgi:hypothetical protein